MQRFRQRTHIAVYISISIEEWELLGVLITVAHASTPVDASGATAVASAYVSIRQHTSAYVSLRQHTSAYVSIRQLTSAYVSTAPPEPPTPPAYIYADI